MENSFVGELAFVGEEINRTEKFRTRDFIVNEIKHVNGRTFENKVKFQLTNDRTDLIDPYNIGDKVSVSFNIKGSEYKGNYYVNLEAWKIQFAQGEAERQPNERSPKKEPEYKKVEEPQQIGEDDLPF